MTCIEVTSSSPCRCLGTINVDVTVLMPASSKRIAYTIGSPDRLVTEVTSVANSTAHSRITIEVSTSPSTRMLVGCLHAVADSCLTRG